jgi:hypothetical protein
MPDEGGRNIGDCVDCPEGYLCTDLGVTDDYDALALCPAGYYCPGASISKSAIDCPTGAYCAEGSVYFIECAVGTYQDNENAETIDDCTACDVNYYCASKGITSASMTLCGDGHVCISGATGSAPFDGTTGDFCPEGNYCTRSLAGEQDCDIGYY